MLDPILSLLLSAPHSLQKISQELSSPLNTVYKHIKKLRTEGYVIDNDNDLFILKEPFPFHIIPEQINYLLKDISHPEILFVDQTESTNTLAKEILHKHREPFILLTRNQPLGRGRMDRLWQMTADHDIAMSFTVPYSYKPQLLFSVTRLVALSIYRVLRKYYPHIAIKWPNDIITKDNQKICGILTENILENNQIQYLIIGIGVNINSTNLPDYASSIRELSQQFIEINYIYSEIITELSSLWDYFPRNEKKISQEWEKSLAWLGEIVSLTWDNKIHQGILKLVLADGSLVLSIGNKDVVFFAGDLSKITLRKK
ncbi:MAG: biotin--[acetyl-CoA-carboxylase] ligase [Brevinema sp.]